MKKKYILLSLVIVTFVLICLITEQKWSKTKFIEYNGFKLAVSVDGTSVSNLPDNNHYLVNYECTNGSTITWDKDNGVLIFDNSYINDSCSLNFESSPLLYDLVKIGDYVEYTGNNGCSGNQCSGWNYEQTGTDLYENFGAGKKAYGWRVLYKLDNSVSIVSAGMVEYYTAVSSNFTLDSISIKYCNTSYSANGVCNEENAHTIDGNDFYNFTSQYYGSNNARYLYNYNDGGRYGEPFCLEALSNTYCGYHNDLIDLENDYFFDSYANNGELIYWGHVANIMINNPSNYGTSAGVRPVIKLDSSIRVTGGLGTMDAPYEISERVVSG